MVYAGHISLWAVEMPYIPCHDIHQHAYGVLRSHQVPLHNSCDVSLSGVSLAVRSAVPGPQLLPSIVCSLSVPGSSPYLCHVLSCLLSCCCSSAV
jgi:hypothetical protein